MDWKECLSRLLEDDRSFLFGVPPIFSLFLLSIGFGYGRYIIIQLRFPSFQSTIDWYLHWGSYSWIFHFYLVNQFEWFELNLIPMITSLHQVNSSLHSSTNFWMRRIKERIRRNGRKKRRRREENHPMIPLKERRNHGQVREGEGMQWEGGYRTLPMECVFHRSFKYTVNRYVPCEEKRHPMEGREGGNPAIYHLSIQYIHLFRYTGKMTDRRNCGFMKNDEGVWESFLPICGRDTFRKVILRSRCSLQHTEYMEPLEECRMEKEGRK